MKSFGKTIQYIGVAIISLLVIGIILRFFRPVASNNSFIIFLFFIVGLLIGGVILYLFLKNKQKPKVITEKIVTESHTVVEGMKKVFKIVTAEGQLQEIFNYEETKKYFKIIPNTKKILVVVKAKVLIGYDFEKFKWNINENDRKISIISFPEPELLSVDTDYKYYTVENNIFNPIKPEDIQHIQEDGKKQLEKAVIKSGLKEFAASQMKTILTEIVSAHNWKLENTDRINILLPENSNQISEENR